MDRKHTDAIAEAVLTPDPTHRQAIARKRAAYERSLAERRHVALWTLPGCAIGAGVAHLASVRFTEGVIWGGIVGAALGWGVVLWRRRSGG